MDRAGIGMIGYKTLAKAQDVSFYKRGTRTARFLQGGGFAALGLRLDPVRKEWRETLEGPNGEWEYYEPAKFTL